MLVAPPGSAGSSTYPPSSRSVKARHASNVSVISVSSLVSRVTLISNTIGCSLSAVRPRAQPALPRIARLRLGADLSLSRIAARHAQPPDRHRALQICRVQAELSELADLREQAKRACTTSRLLRRETRCLVARTRVETENLRKASRRIAEGFPAKAGL